jgi:PAS domain S-box-containing protein
MPALATVPAAGGGTQKNARLLSMFLVLMGTIFATSDGISYLTRPNYSAPWYGYLFLLTAAALNRAGRYLPAAALTLAMFPLVTLVHVFAGGEPRGTFTNLIIGVILASILLDRRGLTLFAAVCFASLFSAPFLMPQQVPDLRTILGPLVLVAIASGLSIILMAHRDLLEQERQEALRKSEERLLLALEASRMGTWEWDPESRRVRASDQAKALFGSAERKFDGTPEGYLHIVHPEDVKAVEKDLREVMAGLRESFELLHRVSWSDGSTHWMQIQGRSTSRGGSRRVNGTVADVTDRKRAEAERDELIHELEHKNAELERFTYTVSHDLKSPLITVRGFLGSIERDVKAGRADRIGSDVERILNATARMQTLLDELLKLSRIGRIVNPPERVAFKDLVQEAMDLVRGRLDAAKVRVEVESNLPDVFGDRSRLVQVLQNLLDNSAKFTGGQETPRVVVGSRPGASDGRPVFFVKDNGEGVAPENLGKMVALFQKLDDRSRGTGVGLAIVKRIVEVHGGKLWVESEGLGKGTTVCFTLPTRNSV